MQRFPNPIGLVMIFMDPLATFCYSYWGFDADQSCMNMFLCNASVYAFCLIWDVRGIFVSSPFSPNSNFYSYIGKPFLYEYLLRCQHKGINTFPSLVNPRAIQNGTKIAFNAIFFYRSEALYFSCVNFISLSNSDLTLNFLIWSS